MKSKISVSEHTGFEVYLEGIKTPFSSITIRESEGSFPTASLSFPATSRITRILPGTVVQIFGPDPLTKDLIILFEGEIRAMGYQKSSSSRAVRFECRSFLSDWAEISARPSDSIVTNPFRQATGEFDYRYYNLSSEDKGHNSQQVTNTLAGLSKALREEFETEVFGELKKALDNIQLTALAGYSTEFVEMMNTGPVKAGDIHMFMQFLLRKFELFNPFYGIKSNSFNISNSISSWPNPGKMGPYKSQLILNNFFKLSHAIQDPLNNNSLNLFNGIRELLSTLYFTLVSPATFPSAYRF